HISIPSDARPRPPSLILFSLDGSSRQMKTYRRWLAVCIALCAAAVAAFVSLYALVLLAGYTGALAMCGSFAPDWWIGAFRVIVPCVVVLIAISAAFFSWRWYRRVSTSTI